MLYKENIAVMLSYSTLTVTEKHQVIKNRRLCFLEIETRNLCLKFDKIWAVTNWKLQGINY